MSRKKRKGNRLDRGDEQEVDDDNNPPTERCPLLLLLLLLGRIFMSIVNWAADGYLSW
jgi:hypothetical protein